jgi:hypothetical protein
MDVTIREAKETDLNLVRKYTVETAWTVFSENERKELDKEKWTKHILEGFEKLSKRETDRIFVAEDESHTFVGYLWVGEGSNMMTGLRHGFVYDIFVREEFRARMWPHAYEWFEYLYNELQKREQSGVKSG